MSKGVYAGALTEKPIYGETQTLSLSLANLDEFFTVSRHNETCKIFDVNRDDSPVGILIEAADTTQSIQYITLTAKQTITNFYAECFYTGGSNTKVQFKVEDTYIIDGLSGTDMSGQKSWRGTLYEGDVVTFYFLNGTTSGYCAYLNCTCDPISYSPILGYETVSVAKKVNNLYVPAIGPIPIYEEVTHTNPALSSSNYTSYYFSAVTDLHNYGVTFASASHGGLRFKPKNIGVHSSEGGYGFVALYDLKNVKIYCKYTTETNYDKVSFWIGEEKILDAVSGTKAEAIVWEGDLPKDTVLDFFYTKDGSKHATSEAVYWEIVCDPTTYTVNEITRYEEGVAARKVKKGYVSINGVAKTFFDTVPAFKSYTGSYTIQQVEIDNSVYNLYTLTSSGVLNTGKETQYWMCGGGGGGRGSSYINATSIKYSRAGNGGGGGYVTSGTISPGEYTVTIGAGGGHQTDGGATSIADAVAEVSFSASGGYSGGTSSASPYGQGQSSGGAGGYIDFTSTPTRKTQSLGSSANTPTIPFGLTSLFKHSAGGGGGVAGYDASSGTSYFSKGGDGGSNGGTGSSNKSLSSYWSEAAGGDSGGGTGGSAAGKGGNATRFGGGGGGGGTRASSSNGGSGYQGVCYILAPAD